MEMEMEIELKEFIMVLNEKREDPKIPLNKTELNNWFTKHSPAEIKEFTLWKCSINGKIETYKLKREINNKWSVYKSKESEVYFQFNYKIRNEFIIRFMEELRKKLKEEKLDSWRKNHPGMSDPPDNDAKLSI